MPSELRPSQRITDYVSGGPNNYAYRVFDTVTGDSQTVCKVRGITLNCNASKLENFEIIRDMILGGNTVDQRTVVIVHTEK